LEGTVFVFFESGDVFQKKMEQNATFNVGFLQLDNMGYHEKTPFVGKKKQVWNQKGRCFP